MKIFIAILLATALFASPKASDAIEDPLAKTNNKFGIHILFDKEITETPPLINSNGGEWGYVIIPIQSGDRDLAKWQSFMDTAYEKKVIPIIRLATEGDYFNTKVWRKPKEEDVLDFANFLSSLDWPVKNRYVVVFNEVNRDDEWGGDADPEEYAKILQYASVVFKSRSQDFFIISAGLDNASINGNGAINKLTYLEAMQSAVPGIFNQIDGFSSHAYPNPGFSQHPFVVSPTSISSFKYEKTLIQKYRSSKLPIFITETGWSNQVIDEKKQADYYIKALTSVWNDPDIAAITPFILRANAGAFEKFSFLKVDNSETEYYKAYKSFAKNKGEPTINHELFKSRKNGSVLSSQNKSVNIPSLWFPEEDQKNKLSRTKAAMDMFSWIFKL